MTYLVTGATGNVGGALIPLLRDEGLTVRALVRDPAKARELPDGVDVVLGDLDDTAALAKAVDGVEGAFYMQAHPSTEQAAKFTEAASAAGVARIALLSSYGTVVSPLPIIGGMIAARDAVFRASGLGVTYLRANALSTNALWWLESIRAENKVYDGTDPGKTVPIDTDDVARAAAVALTQDGHAGRGYLLNGPEALSAREQTAILSEVIGRPLEFVALTPAAFAQRSIDAGTPEPAARGLQNLHEGFAAGIASVFSEEFTHLTGRTPNTFRAWCERNAARFR